MNATFKHEPVRNVSPKFYSNVLQDTLAAASEINIDFTPEQVAAMAVGRLSKSNYAPEIFEAMYNHVINYYMIKDIFEK